MNLQLLDANLSPIANGSTTSLASVSGGGAYSVTYYARYRSNGVAGAGAVKGSATFTLSYQ